MRRSRKIIMLAVAACLMVPSAASAQTFTKVNDGKRDATDVIQDAINACSRRGGGEVVIPPGEYLCGTIRLRSHVSLVISRGAVIKGSTNYKEDYENRSFFIGDNIEDFSICGGGVIDGQADKLDFVSNGFKNNDKIRPYILYLVDCHDFTVSDVSLVNSGRWTFRMRRCERAHIDKVKIRSLEYINNDGIDIDGKDITVSNCIINADDDAVCLKSDDSDYVVENICITNCILSSNSNPIKMGTASRGGFRNIVISNCAIRPNPVSNRRDIWKMYRNIEEGTIAGLSGIAIECVDGGIVENISVSNISMSGITTPIFLCLNRRNGAGVMKDVLISNINAVTEGVLPCIIAGIPEKKISNVRLSNINIIRKSSDIKMDENPKESPTSYPEARMFGHRNPACGIYARHVEGITVDNFNVKVLGEGEERPVIVLDDVEGEVFRSVSYEGTSGEMLERR
jgi:polygalacturonase